MARNKGSGAPSGALQVPKHPQKPSRSRAIGKPDWFPGSKEAADYPLPCTDFTSNPPAACCKVHAVEAVLHQAKLLMALVVPPMHRDGHDEVTRLRA